MLKTYLSFWLLKFLSLLNDGCLQIGSHGTVCVLGFDLDIFFLFCVFMRISLRNFDSFCSDLFGFRTNVDLIKKRKEKQASQISPNFE